MLQFEQKVRFVSMVAAKNTQPVSLDEFIEFAFRPENSEREFELIYGEIVEALFTTTYRSQIMHFISIPVQSYCIEHNFPCHISGATGPYHVQGNVLLPKFAYKPTMMSSEYPDPVPQCG
jgi:Uma2 family endonuclease